MMKPFQRKKRKRPNTGGEAANKPPPFEIHDAVYARIPACDLMYDRHVMAGVQVKFDAALQVSNHRGHFAQTYGILDKAIVVVMLDQIVLINGYGAVAKAQRNVSEYVEVSAVFPTAAWQMDLLASADPLGIFGSVGLLWFHNHWGKHHRNPMNRIKNMCKFLGLDGDYVNKVHTYRRRYCDGVIDYKAIDPLDCSKVYDSYCQAATDPHSAKLLLNRISRPLVRSTVAVLC